MLTESYADAQLGAYRFVAGKRNTLRSVGYFRYPLDFYDTPSLVTTGAEDPRCIVETRNGPVMASAERRWKWGSAGVEYLQDSKRTATSVAFQSPAADYAAAAGGAGG